MLILRTFRVLLAIPLFIWSINPPTETKTPQVNQAKLIQQIRAAVSPGARAAFPDRTAEGAKYKGKTEAQLAQEAANAQAALEAAQAAQQAQVVSTPVQAAPSVPSGSIQALAQSILASRGMSGEWPAMNFIISRESGWDLYNWNGKSSGIPLSDNRACGLVQALPCSKIVWGDAGSQINWFINYAYGRYGSINGAYSYWLAHSYY